jgi:small nuclear ribonucleoprotein (snRNP)-like protein
MYVCEKSSGIFLIDCSIRGTVDGFVRGFDKHFNLLLTDVDETYAHTAPPSLPGSAARSAPLRSSSSDSSASPAAAVGGEAAVLSRWPATTATTSAGSTAAVVCLQCLAYYYFDTVYVRAHRHLPQLLVRGDNVVLVCFRDNAAPHTAER